MTHGFDSHEDIIGVMSDGESRNEPYFVKIVSMACGS